MLLQSSTYFNAYGFLLINHSLLIGSLGGAKIKVANVLEEKERKKKASISRSIIHRSRKRETFLRVS